jgi:ABC-type sulfate/molybdate transport systems ATPase subunit
MTAALAAAGLVVERGPRRVLDGVDIELRRGEVTVLLGPNGAGKSTLLGALANQVPLAAGRIEAAGRIAAAAQTAAFARRGVRANVELALAWWGVPRAERPRRAAKALDLLGAGELAERQAATLSGGEARRVHLARVLAVRPDVLLLDEPFAGLDPTARADVLYDLAAILRDTTRATCVVVHDRAEAWALADRVLVLLDGRIAAAGPPEEVLDNPPTPAVARFLGFDGEVLDGEEIVMARSGQVALDPTGCFRGQVERRIPIEDGVRLEISLPGGRLTCGAGRDAPSVGATVRLRIDGGVRFPPAVPEAF